MMKSNKVLSFKQDSKFHYRLGTKYLDDNKIDDAILHLKTAVDKAPLNYDYSLELGELLSDLDMFEESNEVLYNLLQSHPTEPIDYFFSIACNFAALNRTDDAQTVLNQYLDTAKNTALAKDAVYMLEDIETYNESLDIKLRRLANLLDLFKDLDSAALLVGPDNRLQLMDSLITLDKTINVPELKKAISNGYLALNSLDKAKKYAEDLLAIEDDNITAICNLAYIDYLQTGHANTDMIADRLENYDNIPNIHKRIIAFTYCRVGMDKAALPILTELARIEPYIYEIQHFYAICQYNCGDKAEASKTWNRLRKIYPFRQNLGYYLAKCTTNINADNRRLGYLMDMPDEEMDRLITDVFDKYDDYSIRDNLFEDDAYRHALLWVLRSKNTDTRDKALKILCHIGGSKAIPYLRALLLNGDATIQLKDDLFIALNILGDDGPFIAKIDGSIAEVKVSALRLSKNQSIKYRRVLSLIEESPYNEVKLLDDKIGILWEEFIRSKAKNSKAPTIYKPEVWAAALQYIVMPTLTYAELAKEYNISPQSISKAVKDIRLELDK